MGLVVLLCFLCGIALLVWFVVILAHRHQRKTQQGWQKFALQNGLRCEPRAGGRKHPRVWGERHRRSVVIEEITVMTGTDGQTVRTRMHLKMRGMPDGLSVYERPAGLVGDAILGGLIGIAETMGAKLPPIVETGDAIFDGKYVTRGFDAETTRSWINTGQRKQTLVAFIAEDDFDTFEDGLRWEGNTPRTAEAIEAIVGKLEYYAERLEKPE